MSLPDRLDAVEPFVWEFFEELRHRCEEERAQYVLAGQTPSAHKANFWLAHTDPEQISGYIFKSRLFLQGFDDFRCGSQISKEQVRFAVLVQHFASQDTLDFQRSREQRMHDDVFEGVLTQAVNAQLITDAHRAEWAVDGVAFVVSDRSSQNDEERKQALLDFRMELVSALEQFLLDFCKRRQLSEDGTHRLLQAVTTQMSQCGLANLDRCSRAGEYMVGGARLKQHVNYNISCMDAGPLGEALKLTLGCLKEGFQFIQRTARTPTADDAGGDDMSTPQGCDPSSRMYQCATLRFTTKLGLESPNGEDQIQCDVIDVYDEVFIQEI